MFLKQKQEENAVKEDKNYYIVDKAVLPEIFFEGDGCQKSFGKQEGKNGTGCGEPCRHQPECVL